MKKSIIFFMLLFFVSKNSYSQNAGTYTTNLEACSTSPVTIVAFADMFNNNNSTSFLGKYIYLFTIGSGWTTNEGTTISIVKSYSDVANTSGAALLFLTPASAINTPSPIQVTIYYENNNGNTSAINSFTNNFERKPFSSRTAIVGDKEICLNVNKTYGLSNLAPNVTVQWSLLNGGSGQLTSLPNNQVSLKMTTSIQTELIATISNSCNQTVTKKMVINAGTPTFNNLTNYTGTVLSSGYGMCEDINLAVNFNSTILEYQWEKVTQDVSANIDMTSNSNSNVLSIYPNCNKEFQFKIRARNSCGWSPWKELSYQITTCTTDCTASTTGISGDNFILYAIPVTDGILNVDVQPTAPWFQNTGNGSQLGTGIDNNGLIYPIKVNISIYNQNGILVSSFPNTMIPAQLNISNLPSGNYLVVFGYNGQSESHTIVKN